MFDFINKTISLFKIGNVSCHCFLLNILRKQKDIYFWEIKPFSHYTLIRRISVFRKSLTPRFSELSGAFTLHFLRQKILLINGPKTGLNRVILNPAQE